MKKFFEKFKLMCTEHSNYPAAVVTALFLVLILVAGHHAEVAADPMAGAYQSYDQSEGRELDKLIETYYKDYAAGDVDALRKVATPVSDEEASYIQFLSQYIDKYQNVKVYSKRGTDDTSYLVSVTQDIKFANIKTAAPSMDFFYVRTNKDGKLYIDNVYSSFNQANNEYKMDQQITALISAFEQQSDVVALQDEVQVACDKAYKKDADLNTFVNETLGQEISNWATSYAQQNAAAASSSQSTSSSSAQ